MAFKLAQNPKFTVDVEGETLGKEKFKIKVTFRKPETEEIMSKDSIKKRIEDLEEAKTKSIGITDADEMELVDLKVRYKSTKNGLMDMPIREVLENVVIGWEGIVDDDNQEIPFSKDVLSELLAKYAEIASAINEVFWKTLFNIKAKN